MIAKQGRAIDRRTIGFPYLVPMPAVTQDHVVTAPHLDERGTNHIGPIGGEILESCAIRLNPEPMVVGAVSPGVCIEEQRGAIGVRDEGGQIAATAERRDLGAVRDGVGGIKAENIHNPRGAQSSPKQNTINAPQDLPASITKIIPGGELRGAAGSSVFIKLEIAGSVAVGSKVEGAANEDLAAWTPPRST